MREPKQQKHYIYSQISEDSELMDTRPHSYGIVFGNIKDVCRQYGIKYKVLARCIEFSAPRIRLQMFIEKLHFARRPYSKKPY